MKFNQDLAIIHAYLCSDGYVIKNPESQKQKYYHIGFRNYDTELLNDFQTRFYNYFKILPRNVNNERCIVQNKEIYNFLTKDYTYYSKNWNLPKLSKSLLKFWLRAYFDCEGWVTNEPRKNRNIGLDCINKKGIEYIQNSLEKFNIKSKVKEIKKRKIFRLYIYGKENLILFKNKIGFFHKEKSKRLENAINSYINYKWDISEFNLILKQKARFRKDINVMRISSILKDNLEKLSNLLKQRGIASNIYKRRNGLGNNYFELVVYKKENINKLHYLINSYGT